MSHQSLGLQEQARLNAELARQLAEEEDRRQQQVSCYQPQCILTVGRMPCMYPHMQQCVEQLINLMLVPHACNL